MAHQSQSPGTRPLSDSPPLQTDDTSLSVAEAGAMWLRRASSDGLEESTVRQYRQHLDIHIAPLIGQEAIDRLTPPRVENFKDTLLRTRSRAMSQKVLTSLKSILGEAVRLGHVSQNPATAIKIRRKSRAPISGWNLDSPSSRIPSRDQLRQLLIAADGMFPIPPQPIPLAELGWSGSTCWHPFFATAVFTGMRSSELRGLVWGHVDLERRVIEVCQRADFRNQLGPPKSAAGYREIPMAPLVRELLLNWKAVCPRLESDLVFPSRNGRVHTNSNIHKQCWGPLQRSVGLCMPVAHKPDKTKPRFSFHTIRHASASLFIDQGWAPKRVQAVMGHSSIQMTFDTYGKLWRDHEADLSAMAALEKQLLK